MMKRFNLLVYVYRGINTLEEKFTRKNHPDYTSDLSKHVLILTAVLWVSGLLFIGIGSLFELDIIAVNGVALTDDASIGVKIYRFVVAWFPWIFCIFYWALYLRQHLHLLPTTGLKIEYGLFTCVFLIILGPYIFPLLIALVLLSIAISIALFLLSVVMTIIALFDGGGSKKRRFSLDNGDKVTEKTGFFGEKYYEGRSGKSYETDDNGRTFSEK